MPALRARVNSLLANKADPSNVSGAINELRSGGNAKSFGELAAQLDRLSDRTARVAQGFQQSLDYLYRTLRNTEQSLEGFTIEDADGRLLGQAGEWTDADGQLHRGGHFVELYVGDSVGNRDAADAPLYATVDGEVIIGKGGRVNVRDQYDGMAAWIGASFDTLAVTGAADNSSGLIRLEVIGHPLVTGDGVLVDEVGGVPNSRGEWTVTSIDADHVDLQGSVFDGAYTSGGTVTRLLHITGAADNGAGLIRLTVTAHAYESGDRVSVLGVGGVPAATGQWTIAVFDVDHFDLEGSTFAGTYTAGGTCVRYFGGGLFQTFAIGDSFANYKLRAFANGDLRIKDALITLDGSAALIELDPDEGMIRVTGKNASNVIVEMSSMTDPATLAPAGFLVKNGASPDTNYIGIGYDHVSIMEGFGGVPVQVALFQGSQIRLYDIVTGIEGVILNGATGNGTFEGNVTAYDLIVNGTTVISHSKNAQFASLTLTTTPLALTSGGVGSTNATGARTNLDVYSKAEVAALLALKADHGTFAVSGGGGGSVTI